MNNKIKSAGVIALCILGVIVAFLCLNAVAFVQNTSWYQLKGIEKMFELRGISKGVVVFKSDTRPNSPFGDGNLLFIVEPENEDTESILKRVKSNEYFSELDDSSINFIGTICEQHRLENSEVIQKIKETNFGYAGFCDLTHGKCFGIDEIVPGQDQTDVFYDMLPDEWVLLVYDADANSFYIWQQNL